MKHTFPRLALALTGIAVSLAFAAPPAFAQGRSDDGLRGGPGVIKVDLASPSGASQQISIPKGRSAVVELPVDARDVMVTNPQIADAILRSPRRITVMGVSPGTTDAAFFDASGRRILSLNIRVDIDYSAVAQTISRVLPGSNVHVEAVNNGVILSGMVANATDADRAVQIAQQFTAKPDGVLNMLSIAGKEQVMLKVRIIEVQRSVVKQLGFNLSATLGQLGSPQYLLNTAAGWGVNGALLGGVTGGYNMDTTQQPEIKVYDPLTGAYDLPSICRTTRCSNGGAGSIATTQTTSGSQGLNKGAATLQAFERVGLVRTLAETILLGHLNKVYKAPPEAVAGRNYKGPVGYVIE